MITLCIKYTLDTKKLRDFEDYARKLREPIQRCGGDSIGYFLPTKFAGPTNFALALINFESLPAYEKYREALARDAEGIAVAEAAEKAGCILVEDRSILQRAS